MSTLVLGFGELGQAVVENLARHPARRGARLAVLKRVLPSDVNPRLSNVEFLVGDVISDSEEHLSKAFRPFDTVISCNGMTLPSDVQVKLARVALTSGIRRYFPWQFGGDYDVIGPESSQDLFTTQLEVRSMLRAQSQMAWVILSTGMFTSFLFEPAFGLVTKDRTKVMAIGSWENSITVTSPKDIGRIVAELVYVYPEVQGVVYAAGDTISMQRLANLVERVLSRPVEKSLKPVSDLKRDLSSDPENGMLKYRVVFGEGIGISWDKSSTFNAAKDIPTETVDEWAVLNLNN